MARIEEKVKDVIEVRPHSTSANFEGDPAKAVASYHFTDITANLMAKWIERMLEVTEASGSAHALAGFRGVGKTHFLAALGGLLKQPDLRARVDQVLVTAALAQLQRRAFPVAFVRRGLQPTLLEEVRDGISEAFPGVIRGESDSIEELVSKAVAAAGGQTVTILIDSAFDRPERVSRDDGAVLSELADLAHIHPIFLAVALDDDIAGADGANVSIAKTFKIDYLDQEHLYKIVDTHVFPKHPSMLPVLERIFDNYRGVVPAFRWSASRFTSLYPLHPSIMELAPFVRLYLPEFALLGFASDAASRIMGRPADSLIAPDEVFDNVEKHLRLVPALIESFETFDLLNEAVVAKTPVMKRLQAKLILKGLLLFSLNDEGITAAEIGASMLIYDENRPDAAVEEIEQVLAAFASAEPNAVRTSQDLDGRVRYAIELSGHGDLRSAVTQAAAAVSESQIRHTLRGLMTERFKDCDLDSGEVLKDAVEIAVDWRGGKRYGRVLWEPSQNTLAGAANDKKPEWEIRIVFDNDLPETPTSELPATYWRPAQLTPSEHETIAGLWVLQNDSRIRTEFADRIAAATQKQSVAAEKVFARVFLEESIFAIDGFDYNLLDEACRADTLREIGSIMLDSLFAARYSLHPVLERPLEMSAVSSLTADFFSGARALQQETQKNARDFAMPLGLATAKGPVLAPLTADEILLTDFASLVLDAVKQNQGSADLDVIFKRLAATPYGLTRESGYLVLGALVGLQLVDFVTTGGDRINRRSLDLNLIWEDIVAVAEPRFSIYAQDRLAAWARLLTGARTIQSAKDEEAILAALSDWLIEWNDRAITPRFDALDDDEINARIWRHSHIALRPFNSVAASIRDAVAGDKSVEDCLKAIADAFSDSDDEFERRMADVDVVDDFILGASMRREALRYSSVVEYSTDPSVEQLRSELSLAIANSWGTQSSAANQQLTSAFERFKSVHAHAGSSPFGLSAEQDAALKRILDPAGSAGDLSSASTPRAIPTVDPAALLDLEELSTSR
jgi:hypothetical protein